MSDERTVKSQALKHTRKEKAETDTAFVLDMENGRVAFTSENLERYSKATNINIKRLEHKLSLWMEHFNNGRWCRLCSKRPVAKTNRYLCNACSKMSISDYEPRAGGLTSGQRAMGTTGKRER